MNENYCKLLKWSVWAHLDNEKNLELILLKGHITIELLLDGLLDDRGNKRFSNYSFSRKVAELERLYIDATIIAHLRELNKIRNKLAHEFSFDIYEGELARWSESVLCSFPYRKYSKFTYRTKIVHAFSALGAAILDVFNMNISEEDVNN